MFLIITEDTISYKDHIDLSDCNSEIYEIHKGDENRFFSLIRNHFTVDDLFRSGLDDLSDIKRYREIKIRKME